MKIGCFGPLSQHPNDLTTPTAVSVLEAASPEIAPEVEPMGLSSTRKAAVRSAWLRPLSRFESGPVAWPSPVCYLQFCWVTELEIGTLGRWSRTIEYPDPFRLPDAPRSDALFVQVKRASRDPAHSNVACRIYVDDVLPSNHIRESLTTTISRRHSKRQYKRRHLKLAHLRPKTSTEP